MKKAITPEDSIISGPAKEQLFFYLGMLFLFGSTISILPIFVPSLSEAHTNIKAIIHSGAALYTIGILILLLRLLRNERLKAGLIVFVLSLSIPIINFRLLDSASITAWAFPMILMIVFLVFNKKGPLIIINIVSISTQLLLWRFRVTADVKVDTIDYLLRIFILNIAFVAGLVINKVYIKRLEENNRQTTIQKLVSEVSSTLLNADNYNLDATLKQVIKEMGVFLNSDRSYLAILDQDALQIIRGYEWCRYDLPIQKYNITELSLEYFPWWLERLKKEKTIYIDSPEALSKDAETVKNILLEHNTKSVFASSMESGDRLLGFMGFDNVEKVKEWSEEDIAAVETVSNIVANALFKIESERTIKRMAYYDHLTDLPNRTSFIEKLNQALEIGRNSGTPVAVIFADLDDFKIINDYLGHNQGDKLLKQISKKIADALEGTGIAARFGGDEFLIMLEGTKNVANLDSIAGELLGLFSEPFEVESNEYFVTASIGIAISPTDGDDAETLIKNADIAMYIAKESGKNQYVFSTDKIKSEAERNTELSNDLHWAIEKEQLLLHYQPQINPHEATFSGFEALLRWQHPELGSISPGVFIPLAERNGAISDIGLWVLEEACRQNKEWVDKGISNARVSVNFSTIQFNDPFLVGKIKEILKKTGLEPEMLDIEITESSLADGKGYLIEMLTDLKELGISISIDDFGTEYSSLGRLKSLPIDKLKIDIQFVRGIETSAKDRAVTKVIINLAKSLDLEVLAEGVETKEQADFLISNGCDTIQGYYYYKPMTAKELTAVLTT